MNEFDTVLRILLSNSRSLSELAKVSGEEIFYFYRGADLSGLDLSNSDLRGMNFDNAIFQSSNLDGIKFDKGAFNSSKIPEKFNVLVDDFDGYIDDILIKQMNRIHVFVCFRQISLESVVHDLNITYKDFSKAAGINLGTFRKARNEKIVSSNTWKSIIKCIKSIAADIGFDLSNSPFYRQPMIKYISVQPNGQFISVSRKEMLVAISTSEIIDGIFSDDQFPDDKYTYKRTPQSLKWLNEFYLAFDGNPPSI